MLYWAYILWSLMFPFWLHHFPTVNTMEGNRNSGEGRTLACSWHWHFKQFFSQLLRRMTKLVPELKDLEYHERCRQLGVTLLEKRRQRGNLIQTWKIWNGMENIDQDVFFDLHESSTRSNTRKLQKRGYWNTLVRANTFSVRVVNNWNSLPVEVVTAPSISAFKARLDQSDWGNNWW